MHLFDLPGNAAEERVKVAHRQADAHNGKHSSQQPGTRALAQLRKADGGKSQHDGGKNSGTQPCFAVMECIEHGKIAEALLTHGGGNGDGLGHKVASFVFTYHNCAV